MTTGKRMTQWLGMALGTALLAGCGDRQPDPQPQPTPRLYAPNCLVINGEKALTALSFSTGNFLLVLTGNGHRLFSLFDG